MFVLGSRLGVVIQSFGPVYRHYRLLLKKSMVDNPVHAFLLFLQESPL